MTLASAKALPLRQPDHLLLVFALDRVFVLDYRAGAVAVRDLALAV
jgi:hypothetical protein